MVLLATEVGGEGRNFQFAHHLVHYDLPWSPATVEQRIGLIRDALPDYQDRVAFASFDGLLVEFARAQGATVIVRGLRALADFEYEFQFAHMNRRLAPGIDSVFFMTDEHNHYVSSSLVKEVASLGGDVTGLVPPAVTAALAAIYAKQ